VKKGKHKANRDNPMKNMQNSLRPKIPSYSSDESFEFDEYMSVQCYQLLFLVSHSAADIVVILASGQRLKSYLSCVSFNREKLVESQYFNLFVPCCDQTIERL